MILLNNNSSNEEKEQQMSLNDNNKQQLHIVAANPMAARVELGSKPNLITQMSPPLS